MTSPVLQYVLDFRHVKKPLEVLEVNIRSTPRQLRTELHVAQCNEKYNFTEY